MSLTVSPSPPPRDGQASAEFPLAFEALENPSRAALLSATVGTPVERPTPPLPHTPHSGLPGAGRASRHTRERGRGPGAAVADIATIRPDLRALVERLAGQPAATRQ